MPSPIDAQSFSVKRSQVEFHNFASLGDTDRAIAHYLDENTRRASVIQAHREFIGPMTPFLEIGANAGHTSYMLANQFGGEGFALDLSADALRHGTVLMDRWQLPRAPIRVAGDAVNLPFRDGSIQFVMACQMLSQFMNIESVFLEVKRVLAPGGVFLFTEEPLRRLLSLRIYRAPYQDRMKPWERKLYDWGLLGYLARDVIGAEQEESFGIRQNHKMYLGDWHRLITKHFAEHRYKPFVPERGWGERSSSAPRAMSGAPRACSAEPWPPCARRPDPASPLPSLDRFETLLRCPDCHGDLARDAVRYPGLRLRLSRAQRGRSLQPAARRAARRTLPRRPRRRDRFLPPQPHRPPGRRLVRTGRRLRQQIPLDRPAGHRRAPPRPRGAAEAAHSWVCAPDSSSPRASRW